MDHQQQKVHIEKAQNFMRQYRDPESRELKKLSANQFMDVWSHYDRDGKLPQKFKEPGKDHLHGDFIFHPSTFDSCRVCNKIRRFVAKTWSATQALLSVRYIDLEQKQKIRPSTKVGGNFG